MTEFVIKHTTKKTMPLSSIITSTKLATQFQIGLRYLLVISLAICFASPLVWLFSTSLKDEVQVLTQPRDFFPGPLHFENYLIVFERYALTTFLSNSFFVTLMSLFGNLLVSSLAGYALARMTFRGREVLFLMTLTCMFLPMFLIIIPRFLIFKEVNLLGTLWPLIIPAAMGSPFCIFMLRQYLRGIPKDLSEAAVIDGCSEFGIYWRIILPLAKPAMIAIGIFSVQWRWNEFIEPLIYLQDESLYTMILGLYQIMGMGAEDTTTHLLMAAVVVTIMPMLAIFLAAQKYFIEGIATTGLKG